eukprot:TRINITY_DN3970_c0_g1_i2.p1 TRINITY_DN3970_c0_g1~~TRINITY_DN3970_c0_g1_i2.p1  ORF type:complete len:176 (-),score=49.76 TRINITY_DN3970_c0_g1_i2:72-599(-)
MLAAMILLAMFILKASCKLGAAGQDSLCTLLTEIEYSDDTFSRACVCTGAIDGNGQCSLAWTATEKMVEFCADTGDLAKFAWQFVVGVFVTVIGMAGMLCVLLRARQRMGDLEDAAAKAATAAEVAEEAEKERAIQGNEEQDGEKANEKESIDGVDVVEVEVDTTQNEIHQDKQV